MTNKNLMMLVLGGAALAYLFTGKKAQAENGLSIGTQYDNYNSSQDDYAPRMGIGYDGKPALIYRT
jgi:hypothetical protein